MQGLDSALPTVSLLGASQGCPTLSFVWVCAWARSGPTALLRPCPMTVVLEGGHPTLGAWNYRWANCPLPRALHQDLGRMASDISRAGVKQSNELLHRAHCVFLPDKHTI